MKYGYVKWSSVYILTKFGAHGIKIINGIIALEFDESFAARES